MLGRGWVKSFVRNNSWSAKNTRSKYIAVIVCMHFGSEKWWFCEWSGQANTVWFFLHICYQNMIMTIRVKLKVIKFDYLVEIFLNESQFINHKPFHVVRMIFSDVILGWYWLILEEVLYNVKNWSPFITSKSSSKILSNSSVFVDFQTKCEIKCQFFRKSGRIESVCFHNWESLTNFLTW